MTTMLGLPAGSGPAVAGGPAGRANSRGAMNDIDGLMMFLGVRVSQPLLEVTHRGDRHGGPPRPARERGWLRFSDDAIPPAGCLERRRRRILALAGGRGGIDHLSLRGWPWIQYVSSALARGC